MSTRFPFRFDPATALSRPVVRGDSRTSVDIERAGRIRHPELTVTVRDVDTLIEALARKRADGRR